MNLKHILLTSTALAGSILSPVSAQDFLDTSYPEDSFSLGVRIGMNTSVSTVNKNLYNIYNHNSWGTGFDLGVVANINIRDYLSIQPGFFFQSRSTNHAYVQTDMMSNPVAWQMDLGHTRRYAFDIPVMVAMHFNIADNLRWNVEIGPYISLNLKTDQENTYFDTNSNHNIDLRNKSVDAGFKFGTGFNILDHYVIGVHYMAGCCDAWKDPLRGGKNKAWTFTIGYDF